MPFLGLRLSLSLTIDCVTVVLVGALAGCSAPSKHWGEGCIQDAECIDSTCQPGSDGNVSACTKTCTLKGQLGCNYDNTVVYRCDGSTLMPFASCPQCLTVVGEGATDAYPWYSSSLRGAFYCDATSKTLNPYARARIPFAMVGDPCSNNNPNWGEVIVYQNNQVESKSQYGLSCSIDRKNILICRGGHGRLRRFVLIKRFVTYTRRTRVVGQGAYIGYFNV